MARTAVVTLVDPRPRTSVDEPEASVTPSAGAPPPIPLTIRERAFERAVTAAGSMQRLPASAAGTAEIRRERRAVEATRRAVRRSRGWFVVVLLTAVALSGYVVLRTDQQLSAVVVWPTAGSQFVEAADSAGDPGYRTTMTIVAGGLNRKSGNLVAEALAPSLSGPQSRVFSLVYGSGIVDADIDAKFDALFQRFRPERLVLYGNSMGGDVVLNIAAHFQPRFADPAQYPPGQVVPTLDTVYLDCTPLGTADVRYSARARADFLTGLTEAVGTDGGAVTRLTAEMLVQRRQWSSGEYPNLLVDGHRFAYKWDEVWREKLNPTGVSTALVKDQYGVIRRFDARRVFDRLPDGTDVVYLRPEVGADDNTINVDRVESALRTLADTADLDLTVVDIPGGSHASAVRDADRYNDAIVDHQLTAQRQRVTEAALRR